MFSLLFVFVQGKSRDDEKIEKYNAYRNIFLFGSNYILSKRSCQLSALFVLDYVESTLDSVISYSKSKDIERIDG